ncbi:MAG: peptidylprolyl isomerase, partial [Pseudomonadota bacterium]
MKKKILVFLFCTMMICVSCKGKKGSEVMKDETQSSKSSFSEPTQSTVDSNKKYTATIKTAKGAIVCELFVSEAPLSVTNFVQLAQGGFYNGLT